MAKVTTAYYFLKPLHSLSFFRFTSSLATELASLIEQNSSPAKTINPKLQTRMQLKRFLELRIKKRVKSQLSHHDGKFHNLIQNVVSNPQTLLDAYNIIKINSNILTVSAEDNGDGYFLNDVAQRLNEGSFDVNANTHSISTRKKKKNRRGFDEKEEEELLMLDLVLPNLKLRVVQEALRIVLEVIFKPNFSKISHGCRSGRGCVAALKYICKGVVSPDWWFTLLVEKKIDRLLMEKLVCVMEDKIEDGCLFGLIRSMFDARVLNFEFGGFPKGDGLPQEGILSPTLMNIYLDLFDSEFHRLLMKYEGVCGGGEVVDGDKPSSALRSWFRRQLAGSSNGGVGGVESSGVKVYCLRFMDEIFFAVSGSRDCAVSFKSVIENYLKESLMLDVGDRTNVLPCVGAGSGVRFLGSLVKRNVEDSPAVKAVHKMKDKVEMFALQKLEVWNYGTARIGKKWLGHGLKKVKESEIKHLADSSSLLSQVSHFRKSGMETDHWYKQLLKIWMQDVGVKNAKSEENVLSKFVGEPALPQELTDSFYEFMKQTEKYISTEADSILKLFPNNNSLTEQVIAKTEIIAPVYAIKKRLERYGLTTPDGFARSANLLVMHDTSEIIDWFSGIACRWQKWYENCANFNEIKLLISDQVRKSCIRTLATKYRIHEMEIEKRFDEELSRLPPTQDAEKETVNEDLGVEVFDNDEALMYGITYSGLCLLSLARIVTEARPCNCFVIGCIASAPRVYTLHVMERQKSPSWKTGFSTCIHPSLNKRRLGLCKQHLRDLYLGHISLQSIDFGAWK
ncbi:nuclear intron maturase 4, mitochondrial-like [Trifolium pratense]|uniref:nuclear intron maturase 4, mitochondrial-like n=1 Tax=Trifolium pratense TaxID=57577 RepID=UPI001E692E99|nr:nuclear intron maturase 4, mitochondrial-like [Trifolium pratense]